VEDSATMTRQNAGFREVEGGRTTVNGLEAYIGSYLGTIQQLGRVQMRVLFVRNVASGLSRTESVYFVAGVAPLDNYPGVSGAFAQSILSFRTMSPADAERLQPNRIQIYTARPGDTWQSIAERESKEIGRASCREREERDR